MRPKKSRSGQACPCRNRDLPIEPIQVRLIRVELEGEIEVLATNLLDSEAYPHHLFKQLYARDWFRWIGNM